MTPSTPPNDKDKLPGPPARPSCRAKPGWRPQSASSAGSAKPHASAALPLGLELHESRSIILGRLLRRALGVVFRHAVREPEHGSLPFRPADLPLAAIC